MREKHLPEHPHLPQSPGRDVGTVFWTLCYTRQTDDLPSIDSDSEVEEENSASKEHIELNLVNPVASPTEISDYCSYDDNEDPEESRADSSYLDAAETSKQSVSEWV